jgi:hypothetical protein
MEARSNMGLKDPRIGYNSVTEFMGSGLPWVTSSVILPNTTFGYSFPKITKRVFVWNHNTGSNIHVRVGFTQNGVEKANYFKIDAGEQFEFDARVKDIYLRSDTAVDSHPVSIYAELVGIDADQMPILTGSINGVPFWEGVG